MPEYIFMILHVHAAHSMPLAMAFTTCSAQDSVWLSSTPRNFMLFDGWMV
jgi:hypothetical protein